MTNEQIIGPRPYAIEKVPNLLIITPSYSIRQLFLQYLRKYAGSNSEITAKRRYLADSVALWVSERLSVLGPLIGKSAVAVSLEILFRSGVEKVVLLGTAGGFRLSSSQLEAGDLILPRGCLYCDCPGQYEEIAAGDLELQDKIDEIAQSCEIGRVHKGKVWTTDRVYRETLAEFESLKNKGAVAVEMEYSAVLETSKKYDKLVAAVFVCSDLLSCDGWQPAFSKSSFRSALKSVCKQLAKKCGSL